MGWNISLLIHFSKGSLRRTSFGIRLNICSVFFCGYWSNHKLSKSYFLPICICKHQTLYTKSPNGADWSVCYPPPKKKNAKNYGLWESREYESYGDSNVEGDVNTPECLPTISNITSVETVKEHCGWVCKRVRDTFKDGPDFLLKIPLRSYG